MISISLAGKKAVVTGASRGIGYGIAKVLAEAGAYVIGTATTEAGAETIHQLFRDTGTEGEGCVLNVTQPTSREDFCSYLKTSGHHIDILVNNAAVTRDMLLLRMKDTEWDEVIDTNLSSVFHLSKYFLKDMLKAKEGRIIQIGSIVGSTGNPGQVNYCAAKAGVIGFAKSLALEVGSRNITVNVVSPGFIETDMTLALSDEQRATIFEKIPMKKLGSVNDIANAVLFLSSSLGSYITGQTLHVNGGMYTN